MTRQIAASHLAQFTDRLVKLEIIDPVKKALLFSKVNSGDKIQKLSDNQLKFLLGISEKEELSLVSIHKISQDLPPISSDAISFALEAIKSEAKKRIVADVQKAKTVKIDENRAMFLKSEELIIGFEKLFFGVGFNDKELHNGLVTERSEEFLKRVHSLPEDKFRSFLSIPPTIELDQTSAFLVLANFNSKIQAAMVAAADIPSHQIKISNIIHALQGFYKELVDRIVIQQEKGQVSAVQKPAVALKSQDSQKQPVAQRSQKPDLLVQGVAAKLHERKPPAATKSTAAVVSTSNAQLIKTPSAKVSTNAEAIYRLMVDSFNKSEKKSTQYEAVSAHLATDGKGLEFNYIAKSVEEKKSFNEFISNFFGKKFVVDFTDTSAHLVVDDLVVDTSLKSIEAKGRAISRALVQESDSVSSPVAPVAIVAEEKKTAKKDIGFAEVVIAVSKKPDSKAESIMDITEGKEKNILVSRFATKLRKKADKTKESATAEVPSPDTHVSSVQEFGQEEVKIAKGGEAVESAILNRLGIKPAITTASGGAAAA